ncbi:Gfo/Idh/MocA family protein [Microbacterium sp. P03]|uniref:Gfo/Idh/MocA family protein n=1 Tax=Microbacterium sp. P03 TaxID=3366946 RepID=UPI0037464E39
MGEPHGVGIVGLGVISRQYLDTLRPSAAVRIAALADLDVERARAVAAEIPGARALSVAELVADPEVRTVLNLTIPAAHEEIALAAISQGKDVYGEKPLAASMEAAKRIMDAAAQGGVRVGSAPDTVLGTGVQTARAHVDGGAVGTPISATATWVSAGHEAWHPHPDFYYQPGGGPLLDMGPYYLTSLVHLLGPVRSVSGMTSRTRSTRTIGSGARAGVQIPVDVDTHVTGVLEHADGALSTVVMSFDALSTTAAPIEVHGTEGSIIVPDPNNFSGVVRLTTRGSDGWESVPAAAGFEEAGRGVGLLDLIHGPARASGAMGLHVLEIMTALLRSDGARVAVASSVERPSLVPLTSAHSWSSI